MSKSAPIRQMLGIRKQQLETRMSKAESVIAIQTPDTEEECDDLLDEIRETREILEVSLERLKVDYDNWYVIVQNIADEEAQEQELKLFVGFGAEYSDYNDRCAQIFSKLKSRSLRITNKRHLDVSQFDMARSTRSSRTNSVVQHTSQVERRDGESQCDFAAPPSADIVSSDNASQGIVLGADTTSSVLKSAGLPADLATLQQPQTIAPRMYTAKPPKLTMPTFTGDIHEWQEFWTIFRTNVHDRPGFTNVEKFSYLIDRLADTAKLAIKGLPINEENYEVAIDLLQKRFDRAGERVVGMLYTEFRKLPQSNRQTQKQRYNLDQCERIFRQLKAGGEDTELNRSLTVEFLSKFPASTVRYVQSHYDVGPNSKLSEARTAIESAITKFEATDSLLADMNSMRPEGKSDGGFKHEKPKSDGNGKRHENETSALASVSPRKTEWKRSFSGNGNARESAEKPLRCYFCSGPHKNSYCLTYPTASSRKKRATEFGRCLKCLRNHQRISECVGPKITCIHCQKTNDHAISLCPVGYPDKNGSSKQNVGKGRTAAAIDGNDDLNDVPLGTGGITALNDSSNGALFQTAKVVVRNPDTGASLTVRIVLDSLSSRSYITDAVADKLGLQTIGNNFLHVNVFGLTKTVAIPTRKVAFNIELKDGSPIRVHANTTKLICNSSVLPSGLTEEQRSLLKNLKSGLADDPFDRNGNADILLSASWVWKIITGSRIPTEAPGLDLLPSKFGFMLSGTAGESDDDNGSTLLCLTETNCSYPSEIGMIANVCKIEPKQPDIDEFWKLESIGITDDPVVNDDDQALDSFNRTIKFENGRYQVQWPWIEEKKALLSTNHDVAMHRFEHLAKRLNRDRSLLKSYQDVIDQQVERGIIERVPENEIETVNTTHYLPHHPVVKLSSNTTKLRIVYDASAKPTRNHLCLNDCLFRGPVILPDLCQLLMRIRTHDILVVSDVEKAFLQVGLQTSERDVTRFFWFKDSANPTLPENLAVYRFQRVNFGVISSPFLLGATIQHHLAQDGTEFSESLKDNIYVDNVISGLSKTDNPILYYHKLKELFKRAGMNIQEFCSNSAELMDSIAHADRVKSSDVKVLGLKWDSLRDDTLRITKSAKWCTVEHLTKRQLLHAIASIFDPLGLFQPVTLPGKLLLQRLWELGASWDDPVDSCLQEEWITIRDSLSQIFEVRIPRFTGHADNFASIAVFSDASAKAYCTSVYLRSKNEKGELVSTLIFSKTRLTPTSRNQRITLPRLELLGATIGANAAEFCRAALKLPQAKVDFFIDSECVLHWIRSKGLLKRFVARRVEAITKTRNCEFHYVDTHENPADLGTRGKSCADLMESKLWWSGPEWLTYEYSEWPQRNLPSVSYDALPSYKQELQSGPETCAVTTENQRPTQKDNTFMCIDLTRFSSLQKLLRVTAICLKFVKRMIFDKLSPDSQNRLPGLGKILSPIDRGNRITAGEYRQAEFLWVKNVQRTSFSDVIGCIEKEQKHALISQLGLVIDEAGLIRSLGRFQHADLPASVRYPCLLPKSHSFSRLVIQDVHQKAMHVGVSHTLSLVRESYWIPHGRAVVRLVLNRCLVCKREKTGKSFALPPMPPWPHKRMHASAAFQHIGLDYFGPVKVRVGESTQKMWACLFTCLTTRAVHLEAVIDNSAVEFLNCLIRFVSRRGVPETITSDNAAQFRVVKLLGDRAWKDIKDNVNIASYSSRNGIKWDFIVELAPWQGGFYERLVGVVKSTLRASIRRKLLTWTDFITLLTEAEAVVNSRPITYVSDDAGSQFRVLKPSDFLTPSMPNALSDSASGSEVNSRDFGEAGRRLVSVWKTRMRTLEHLWKVWQEDYLTSLRERGNAIHRGSRGEQKEQPVVNQVVLIHDEDLPRSSWKVGIITQIFKSSDGQIRSAEVKQPNGTKIRRSVKHLIPLEVETSYVDTVSNDNEDATRQQEQDEEQFYGFDADDIARTVDALNKYDDIS